MRFSACPPSSRAIQSPGITLQPVSSTPTRPSFGGYRIWDHLTNGVVLPILPRSQKAVFPPSCFECSYKHCVRIPNLQSTYASPLCPFSMCTCLYCSHKDTGEETTPYLCQLVSRGIYRFDRQLHLFLCYRLTLLPLELKCTAKILRYVSI